MTLHKSILELTEQYLSYQKDLSGNNLYLNQHFNFKNNEKTHQQDKLITNSENKLQLDKSPKKSISNSHAVNNLISDQTKNQNETISKDWADATSMAELNTKIENCKNCILGNSRLNFVFGTGNHHADILIIGEAPGADEDELGKPFVGRAGQLLTKILEAINLSREEVFIANILKCRPPNNRVPTPAEVEQCEPYLKKQIELIKPEFILALGLTAANTLFKSNFKMADIRGQIKIYNNIKTLVTYHPSALLRNPNWKTATWEDVKLLRSMYDEYLKSKIN
ncbi:MAG: uracil-DNA glycosylase [Candidatus Kapabacteria bacterium]|nr:uracil-DNA glycosylase [Candidatus Kapabacteria bacterium]